jgi:hypothetical protein
VADIINNYTQYFQEPEKFSQKRSVRESSSEYPDHPMTKEQIDEALSRKHPQHRQ